MMAMLIIGWLLAVFAATTVCVAYISYQYRAREDDLKAQIRADWYRHEAAREAVEYWKRRARASEAQL